MSHRRRRTRRRVRRWIQHAVRKHKRGSLHRMLGVPLGRKIPIAMLWRAARSRRRLLRQRAQFALNVRRLKHRRRR